MVYLMNKVVCGMFKILCNIPAQEAFDVKADDYKTWELMNRIVDIDEDSICADCKLCDYNTVLYEDVSDLQVLLQRCLKFKAKCGFTSEYCEYIVAGNVMWGISILDSDLTLIVQYWQLNKKELKTVRQLGIFNPAQGTITTCLTRRIKNDKAHFIEKRDIA